MEDWQYIFVTAVTPEQVQQIVSLYQSEGWWDAEGGDNAQLVLRIISGSHCFLLVFEGEQIVGMGRAISDRASDAYIQDIQVRMSHRGKGIGTTIIHRIVERLHADDLRWIGLIAEKGSYRFYEKLGFNVMPASEPMLMKR